MFGFEGEALLLDGSASFDPEGTKLQYNWKEIGGTGMNISTNDSIAPLTPPVGTGDGIMHFDLIVTDQEGATSLPTDFYIIVSKDCRG